MTSIQTSAVLETFAFWLYRQKSRPALISDHDLSRPVFCPRSSWTEAEKLIGPGDVSDGDGASGSTYASDTFEETDQSG
jgi:hypothetical protein